VRGGSAGWVHCSPGAQAGTGPSSAVRLLRVAERETHRCRAPRSQWSLPRDRSCRRDPV